MWYKLLILCIAVLLIGCRAEFEDVSEREQYKHFIGNKYSLVQEMYISGVNLPPGYSDEIHTYSIGRTKPSWSGPELISRDLLPIGTTLKVISIKECINCPFDQMIHVVINITPYKKAVSVPVTIDIKYITEDLSEYVKQIK